MALNWQISINQACNFISPGPLPTQPNFQPRKMPNKKIEELRTWDRHPMTKPFSYKWQKSWVPPLPLRGVHTLFFLCVWAVHRCERFTSLGAREFALRLENDAAMLLSGGREMEYIYQNMSIALYNALVKHACEDWNADTRPHVTGKNVHKSPQKPSK